MALEIAPEEGLESYRPLLFTVAYQLTGSANVAEDLVQDTYVRYQQMQRERRERRERQERQEQDTPPEAAIRSLKAYLTTITTRLALDYLKSARHTREVYVGTWLPEPLLTESAELPAEIVERQEMISVAFLMLLETLTPPERAVFVLREVLDFSYDEIARILDRSVASCRQTFHRAQQHLATKRRQFDASRESQQALVASFLLACQQGQLDDVVRLLAQDATLWSDSGGKAPAVAHSLHGAAIVARFFRGLARKGANLPVRTALVETNGAPTLLIWEDDVLTTSIVFVTEGDKITAVYSQRNPEKLVFLNQQLATRNPNIPS